MEVVTAVLVGSMRSLPPRVFGSVLDLPQRRESERVEEAVGGPFGAAGRLSPHAVLIVARQGGDPRDAEA